MTSKERFEDFKQLYFSIYPNDKTDTWYQLWQACEAQSAARIAQLEEALHMMDEIEPTEDRVFKEHETFCSLVEPSSWGMVDGVKKILSYRKNHIVFHKCAMSDERGLQIMRFTKQVDDTHWSFAGNPWSGVYLTPNEWAIVMRKALATADKIKPASEKWFGPTAVWNTDFCMTCGRNRRDDNLATRDK